MAEIVSVWPQLPEHIKAAIRALIQTHNSEKKRMYNMRKRIDKVEKQLFPTKQSPHIVNVGGLEMSSDEFEKLLDLIYGGKGKLPSQEEKRANERY